MYQQVRAINLPINDSSNVQCIDNPLIHISRWRPETALHWWTLIILKFAEYPIPKPHPFSCLRRANEELDGVTVLMGWISGVYKVMVNYKNITA